MDQTQTVALLWLIVAMIAENQGKNFLANVAFLVSIFYWIFVFLEFLLRFAG